MTSENWQRAAAYERYMGRWSRLLATRFVGWLQPKPEQRWLDVGCGTGALCASVLAMSAPRSLTGVDPADGLLAAARAELPSDVRLLVATADRLPFGDAEFDLTVSALVLNFVPDSAAALREMVRVTAPGGRVAACVWDYAQRMDLVRSYWDAAAHLGLLAPGQDQGERFAICRPDALAEAFDDAGLVRVEVSALELEMRFTDFDDYWLPFLGGQGSAPTHAVQLGDDERDSLRELLRHRLPVQGDGSIRLAARAWTASGVVAA